LNFGKHPHPDPDLGFFKGFFHVVEEIGLLPQFGAYFWKKMIGSSRKLYLV